MKKLKILHVIPTLGSGGAEKLINDILPEIKTKGYDVDLFVINNDNPFFIKKIINSKIKIFSGKEKKIHSYKNLTQLNNLIMTNEYEIVHGHLFPTNYWLAFLSIFNKAPKYVFTEHSTHNRRRKYKSFRFVEKYIYGKFEKIISISEDTKKNLTQWLKESKTNKHIVINNGIDIRYFQNGKSLNKKEMSDKIRDKDFLLLMVGSFSKQKDQDSIIYALKNLPKYVKLVLVGDGPRKNEISNLVGKLKLEDRVIFLGLRDDVNKINKTCDLIVVSSHWEGFGLVAAEGMAAGKPVIASNVPGLSDVVSNAGLLFEKENHHELSKQIKEVLNNRKLYRELSSKGIKKVAKYDIINTSCEYVLLYKQLVQ